MNGNIEKDGSPESVALGAFRELKNLITEELGDADYSGQAFSPLTDGLGLESPRKKEVPKVEQSAVTEPVQAFPKPLAVETVQAKGSVPTQQDAKKVPPSEDPVPVSPPEAKVVKPAVAKCGLASVIEPPKCSSDGEKQPVAPPPVPRPSIIKRILAAIVDEFFVLTLLLLALSITMKLLSGAVPSAAVLKENSIVRNPEFLRFAVLEFTTLWLVYFSFCFGVLDMTFGMWVWGFRVGYGSDDSSRFSKKTLRALWSFLFYAPMLPLAFLIFQRKGKNLLDGLSGTSVYQSS
ncbi:MAG: RDD family protein [Deltaproteobacteria bacterium]|nr:RDD family protein [Deltaproteobacteria bacterium]